jgi:hypothetical protein
MREINWRKKDGSFLTNGELVEIRYHPGTKEKLLLSVIISHNNMSLFVEITRNMIQI